VDAAAVAAISATIGVLGTLAGVLIGGSLNEIWASKREQRAEARLKARATEDRVRNDRIEAVDQTRRATAAMLSSLAAKAGGNPAYTDISVGLDTYPRLNLTLIDDPLVMRYYLALCADLAPRPFGSGFTTKDTDRVATAQTAMQAVFERQRARAMAGEDVPTLSDEQVTEMPEFGAGFDAMGVPRPGPAVKTGARLRGTATESACDATGAGRPRRTVSLPRNMHLNTAGGHDGIASTRRADRTGYVRSGCLDQAPRWPRGASYRRLPEGSIGRGRGSARHLPAARAGCP
jgi:hypothetical protein